MSVVFTPHLGEIDIGGKIASFFTAANSPKHTSPLVVNHISKDQQTG